MATDSIARFYCYRYFFFNKLMFYAGRLPRKGVSSRPPPPVKTHPLDWSFLTSNHPLTFSKGRRATFAFKYTGWARAKSYRLNTKKIKNKWLPCISQTCPKTAKCMALFNLITPYPPPVGNIKRYGRQFISLNKQAYELTDIDFFHNHPNPPRTVLTILAR